VAHGEILARDHNSYSTRSCYPSFSRIKDCFFPIFLSVTPNQVLGYPVILLWLFSVSGCCQLSAVTSILVNNRIACTSLIATTLDDAIGITYYLHENNIPKVCTILISIIEIISWKLKFPSILKSAQRYENYLCFIRDCLSLILKWLLGRHMLVVSPSAKH
jgi:hypothetical protein